MDTAVLVCLKNLPLGGADAAGVVRLCARTGNRNESVTGFFFSWVARLIFFPGRALPIGRKGYDILPLVARPERPVDG